MPLRAHFADTRPKVFLDMDGVLCDTEVACQKVMAERGLDRNELFREYGFYLGIPPMEGAIDAVAELDKVFNVYILSTPKWSNPDSFKEKRMWVERYLYNPGFKKLILCHNKGLFTGRALVDDRADRNNQNNFQGEHILFGQEPFLNWEATLPYLLENPFHPPREIAQDDRIGG